MTEWDIQKARQTYNMDYWSGGYFDINEQGHVIACPDRDAGSEGLSEGIDLYALSREFNDAGLSLPVLVRFTDILHDRVDTLCSAFRNAMEEQEYEGDYTAVYPIKVNQQRSVVEEIISAGGDCVGLEAGSKP